MSHRGTWTTVPCPVFRDPRVFGFFYSRCDVFLFIPIETDPIEIALEVPATPDPWSNSAQHKLIALHCPQASPWRAGVSLRESWIFAPKIKCKGNWIEARQSGDTRNKGDTTIKAYGGGKQLINVTPITPVASTP